MGKVLKARQSAKERAENAPQAAKANNKKPGDAKRKPRGRSYIDEERCKGCGFCVAFCPRHVLELSERFNSKGYHPPEIKHPDECIGCGLCGFYCPDFAIFGVRIADPKKETGK